MVIYNELRITKDGQTLIIDVQIDNTATGDTNQKIDQIWIDNSVPRYENGCPQATQTAILLASINDSVYTDDIEKFVPIIIPEEGRLRVKLDISRVNLLASSDNYDLDIARDLCHIYVLTSGTNNMICNCNPAIRTVSNLYPIYQRSMYFFKDLGHTCNPQQDFINFILKLKSLEYSIKSGNYIIAHKIWLTFNKQYVPKSNCGCGNG